MNKIPMADYIDRFVDWVQDKFGDALKSFSDGFEDFIEGFIDLLLLIPWWVLVLLFIGIAFKVKGWKLALGTLIGLLLVFNLELWEPFVGSLVLVLLASIICMIIGLPLGIIAGRNSSFYKIISPILDFMQTMPSFVYLIPVLLFFGIGKVPAIFATVIFAMPPAIRFTALGIKQVPEDLIEVGEAFGSTPWQLLWKVQMPLALPTIMAGLNQTIMLSLSMVVISAMIGAAGLGAGVLRAIGQINVGQGFEYGIAVVIMAIVLDRIFQSVGSSLRTENKKKKKKKK